MKIISFCISLILLCGTFFGTTLERNQEDVIRISDPVIVDLKTYNSDDLRITARGTGRTTGHILDLQAENLTDGEIVLNIPPVFIPSDGKRQPYIVPESNSIRVPAGSTVVHPINGYCADNEKPPLGSDHGAPPIDDWQEPDPDKFDDEGLDPSRITVTDEPVFDNGNPVFDPFVELPSDLIRIMRDLLGTPYPPPGSGPVAPDELNPSSLREGDPDDLVINIPTNVLPRTVQDPIFDHTNTGDPLPFDVSVLEGRDFPVIDLDFDAEPENTANLLFDAITKITDVVNEMVETGIYDYPFAPEEVIQQTFWIYTGSLRESPYIFEDFRENMSNQYERVRGMPLDEAPEEEIEQFDEGVENFWSGFQVIGEEAKVIKNTRGVNTKETKVSGVYTPTPDSKRPTMPWEDLAPGWEETLISWDEKKIWEEQQNEIDDPNGPEILIDPFDHTDSLELGPQGSWDPQWEPDAEKEEEEQQNEIDESNGPEIPIDPFDHTDSFELGPQGSWDPQWEPDAEKEEEEQQNNIDEPNGPEIPIDPFDHTDSLELGPQVYWDPPQREPDAEEEEEEEDRERIYFDCENSSYPDVTYLSEDDYHDGTARGMQAPGIAGGAINSAIFRGLRDYNPDINFKDQGIFDHPHLTPHGNRYFITNTHEFDPETNTCTVTLRVYDGMPYDPSRDPQLTVKASASYGDERHDGWGEVDSEGLCYSRAAQRATQKLVDSGLFSEGFENECPDHLVYNPENGMYYDPNQ